LANSGGADGKGRSTIQARQDLAWHDRQDATQEKEDERQQEEGRHEAEEILGLSSFYDSR
jgi:hypothetical protein